MDKNYGDRTFISKYLKYIPRRPGVANFADIIKSVTTFIKTIIKN